MATTIPTPSENEQVYRPPTRWEKLKERFEVISNSTF